MSHLNADFLAPNQLGIFQINPLYLCGDMVEKKMSHYNDMIVYLKYLAATKK